METVAKARRPRGRPRAFDRAAALETATALFWEKGFAGTSIGDLSAALKINPPSLYAAFGDKKTLFEDAVDCYQAGPGAFAREALEGGPTAKDAIRALLFGAAEAFTSPAHPRGCMVVLAAANCADEDAAIMSFLAGRRKGAETMIRRRLDAGRREGELPERADPAALASYYFAVFQGMSIKARDGASRKELEAIAGLAMAAWPAE
jgi:TetR/AcrR family transcriptional regulator, copper-responsive repressor